MEIEKDRDARYKTWRYPMPEFPEDFYNNLYSKKALFKKIDESIIDLETRGKAFLVKTGAIFKSRVIEEVQLGSIHGIIPEITGFAYLTSINNIVMDERDELRFGFKVN